MSYWWEVTILFKERWLRYWWGSQLWCHPRRSRLFSVWVQAWNGTEIALAVLMDDLCLELAERSMPTLVYLHLLVTLDTTENSILQGCQRRVGGTLLQWFYSFSRWLQSMWDERMVQWLFPCEVPQRSVLSVKAQGTTLKEAGRFIIMPTIS